MEICFLAYSHVVMHLLYQVSLKRPIVSPVKSPPTCLRVKVPGLLSQNMTFVVTYYELHIPAVSRISSIIQLLKVSHLGNLFVVVIRGQHIQWCSEDCLSDQFECGYYCPKTKLREGNIFRGYHWSQVPSLSVPGPMSFRHGVGYLWSHVPSGEQGISGPMSLESQGIGEGLSIQGVEYWA